MPPANPFETGLDPNPANSVPLTPLSFLPRAAQVHPERTAVVQPKDATFLPESGTRGEALIPASRFGPVVRPPTADDTGTEPLERTEPAEDPEHPPWENQDEDWSEGMPLLADLKPIRPRDRLAKLVALWMIA